MQKHMNIPRQSEHELHLLQFMFYRNWVGKEYNPKPNLVQFFCVHSPCDLVKKLESGHIHWENWALIMKHIGMLSHQSDYSGK